MVCSSRIQHDLLWAMWFTQWRYGVLCWKQDDFFLGDWHLLRISCIYIFQQLYNLCTLCKYFCSNFLMGTNIYRKNKDWSLNNAGCNFNSYRVKTKSSHLFLISPTRWTKINIRRKRAAAEFLVFWMGYFHRWRHNWQVFRAKMP